MILPDYKYLIAEGIRAKSMRWVSAYIGWRIVGAAAAIEFALAIFGRA
jgi:hypothetical protein